MFSGLQGSINFTKYENVNADQDQRIPPGFKQYTWDGTLYILRDLRL